MYTKGFFGGDAMYGVGTVEMRAMLVQSIRVSNADAVL